MTGDAVRLTFPPALAAAVRAAECSFVVTGGSGWIAAAALEMLDAALGDAMTTRVAIFGSSDRLLRLRSGHTIPCRDLKQIASLDTAPRLFVHTAFLTRDKTQDVSAADYIAANRAIGDMVATAAVESDLRGLFGFSSGAAYRKGTHQLDCDIDANPYGVLKAEDETRFAAIAAQKQAPFCMPRLFNLSGPFINKLNTYALSSMIGCVQQNRPIAIRAAHRVVRSYVHVADLIALGFAMMLQPQADDRPVFDTEGRERLEVGELAERVRSTLNRADLAIERPPLIESGEDVYVGDGSAMRGMLQAHNLELRDMPAQITDTAAYMREIAMPGERQRA